MVKVLTTEEIIKLAQQTASVTVACSCSPRSFLGWQSVPITFPEEIVFPIGAVRAQTDEEPTVEEFHPRGTNYWSDDAPIALRFFPVNRCSLWQCRECERCYLRYTEFGGYYIDKRIRLLQLDLLDVSTD